MNLATYKNTDSAHTTNRDKIQQKIHSYLSNKQRFSVKHQGRRGELFQGTQSSTFSLYLKSGTLRRQED